MLKKFKMKATITSLFNFLILITVNIQLCLGQMEPLNALSTGITITSGILDAGQFLWGLDRKENIMTDIKNNDIYEEIQLMNSDTHTILGDIPEQVVMKENKQSFEQKVDLIENIYKDMVDFNSTYRSQSTTAKSEMLRMCNNMLRYSLDGPVKLLNDVMNLLAFGSFNILDKIKEKSYVRMKE